MALYYNTGTLTLANAATTGSIAGAADLTTVMKAGDILKRQVSGYWEEIGMISSLTTTGFTLVNAYTGTALSGVAYRCDYGIGWLAGGAVVSQYAALMSALNGQGLMDSGAADPSTAPVRSNTGFLQTTTKRIWAWVAGSWQEYGGAPAIHAATVKAAPVDADEFGFWDSVSGLLRKLTFANLKAALWAALGALINAGTAKTTPVDADLFAMSDSAASWATKVLSWASLKATAKGYFDTLYPPQANATFTGTTYFVGTTDASPGGTGTTAGVALNAAGYLSICRSSTMFVISCLVSGVQIFQLKQGTTQVGSITVTSSATAFNTSSDYRLKRDIEEMTNAAARAVLAAQDAGDPTGASARIAALRPVKFRWIRDGEAAEGFLAHELQEVVPAAVTGVKDEEEDIGTASRGGEPDVVGIVQSDCPEGYAWTKTGTRPVYQGIDMAKVVPLLVAALQETRAELAGALARIAVLETPN